MGFRFRRRVKILPGVHLNISKRGVSTSIGRRGASVTVGHGKVRTNLGIPGSGLSYNTVDSARAAQAEQRFGVMTGVKFYFALLVAGILMIAVWSGPANDSTFLLALTAFLFGWPLLRLAQRANADGSGRAAIRVSAVLIALALTGLLWALTN